MEFKGKDCHGGKNSKERLTVLLGANADGSEKLKPVVIGKYARPHCFKGIKDLSTLPVQYEYNSTAWMKAEIFTRWLKALDRKMKCQGRKILLVLDNCTAHTAADLNLHNVAVAFLPPNATSKVQPMDRGIINAMKVKYRSFLLKKIICKMDAGESPKPHVLEAIHGLSVAWSRVTQSCISNCFKSAGLVKESGTSMDVEEIEEDSVPLDDVARRLGIDNVDFAEYVSVDSEIHVYGEPDLREIAQNHATTEENDPESEDDNEELVSIEYDPPVSVKHALASLSSLRNYILSLGGNMDLLSNLEKVENFVVEENVKNLKQTKINSYFPTSV